MNPTRKSIANCAACQIRYEADPTRVLIASTHPGRGGSTSLAGQTSVVAHCLPSFWLIAA